MDIAAVWVSVRPTGECFHEESQSPPAVRTDSEARDCPPPPTLANRNDSDDHTHTTSSRFQLTSGIGAAALGKGITAGGSIKSGAQNGLLNKRIT